MAYSEIEKEIIFLKAVQELIDEMVNLRVLKVVGEDPHSEIRLESSIHQRFFYIILVDFLSQSDKKVMGEKISYLGALRRICESPHFNVNGSIENLKNSSSEFTDWLEQDTKIEELPTTNNEAVVLSIKRIEFLKMCGNISKHNFSRLSGVARELREIFKRNEIEISSEEALIILDEFYERFHDDILIYHSSTIAEFLNNIRWGIHNYLIPEYKQSIVLKGGDPREYKYTFPRGVESKFVKNTYWELMNAIRLKPPIKKFKVNRYLKLRY